jgi:hypothetical protein
MKRLLVIILIAISLNVFGQDHWIGFQGGLERSNVTSTNSFSDTKFRPGITCGFNYELRFHNKWSLGADLLYTQKGFNFKTVFTDNFGNVTGKSDKSQQLYDYLSIPIKIGYTIGNKLKGFAKIGICPSTILKAEGIYPVVDINANYLRTDKYNYIHTVSKFDLGGLIELGARYGLKNNLELFSSFTYNKSFTTFSNDKFFKDSKMRHYDFSLAVGLKFKLHVKKLALK